MVSLVSNYALFYLAWPENVEKVKPWSQLAHSCLSLSRFLQHEAASSISTPPGRDASPSQVTPLQFVRFPQQFAGTHLYSWVERGTVGVGCLAQEHNTVYRTSNTTKRTGSNPECSLRERAHWPLENLVKRQKIISFRPRSYSRYQTGTNMQWRLMRGISLKRG